MGEMIDKLKGAANTATGKARKAIGENTGDASLAAGGQAQEAKGRAQNLSGTIKGAFGNKI
ncbi:CsbD family protein [Novosphingobium flavum]|uniref:CsbD family protein n=1 Tax=Novosphingobium flavum TaxID=1778672 RepID=A0A7X1FSQ5_9SPHN|nr:CsbD family protein [Novosphingobium flavum]MBC2666263.1 CsbD family protein [Novosphingobium flavum]